MKISESILFQCIRSAAVLIVAICVVGLAYAESAGVLVDVVSTGHGSTVREATRAALRAAVEQVVGTMVDATTLVENDKLIEDEILSYSAGMVASSKIIGEPKKSEDGFYAVKLKATVKKGRLEEKLRGASAVNVALDGADLFARMTTAKDNLADAEAMIKDVLSKHVACVVAEAIPGKNGKSPIDLDPKTGEVFVNVRVRIDQTKYTQFANEVVEKIGAMATDHIKLNSLGHNGEAYRPNGGYRFEYKTKDYPFLVMTSFRTGSAVAFQLDKNILKAILSSLDTGSLAVAVTLYDTQGGEIAEPSLALCKDRAEGQSYYASMFSSSKDDGLILPLYDAFPTRGGDNIDSFHSGKCEGTYRISLGSFAADELKSIGNLKIKVGHMKGNHFVDQ